MWRKEFATALQLAAVMAVAAAARAWMLVDGTGLVIYFEIARRVLRL